jgi:hypothetical protein
MPSTSTSGRSTDLAAVSGGLVARLRSDRGPRVASLVPDGGPELLADLPGATLAGPHGIVHLLGGHRLWTAPERPDRTYRPDDVPCEVTVDGHRVRATAPDDGSGIERSLAIWPTTDGIAVEGRLMAVRRQDEAVAPWMITQFDPGGVAVLPMRGPATGLEASHGLAVWPYTDLSDGRLRIGPRHLEVHATGGSPLKLGTIGSVGRLGYLRDGWLFMKTWTPPKGPVPDLGASGQVYDGAGFLELESVGALVELDVDDEAVLVEEWTVRRVAGVDEAVGLVVDGR